ncbi:hypothetical protein P9112_010200 [Eukaryota sp. TZLM1-RC]
MSSLDFLKSALNSIEQIEPVTEPISEIETSNSETQNDETTIDLRKHLLDAEIKKELRTKMKNYVSFQEDSEDEQPIVVEKPTVVEKPFSELQKIFLANGGKKMVELKKLLAWYINSKQNLTFSKKYLYKSIPIGGGNMRLEPVKHTAFGLYGIGKPFETNQTLPDEYVLVDGKITKITKHEYVVYGVVKNNTATIHNFPQYRIQADDGCY